MPELARIALRNAGLSFPGRTGLSYKQSNRGRLLSLLIQSLDLK